MFEWKRLKKEKGICNEKCTNLLLILEVRKQIEKGQNILRDKEIGTEFI